MLFLNPILFSFLVVFSSVCKSTPSSYNDVNECLKQIKSQEKPIDKKSTANDKVVINRNPENNGYHIVIRPIQEDYFFPNYGPVNGVMSREKRLTENIQDSPRIVKVALTSYMGPGRQKRRVSKKKSKKRVCVRRTTLYPKLREVDVTIDKNLIGKVPLDIDTEINTVLIATVKGNGGVLKMPRKMSDLDYEQVENLGSDSENSKVLSKSEAKKSAGIDLDVVNRKEKIKIKEKKTKTKRHMRHYPSITTLKN